MAAGKEFVQYIADQISGAGEIRYRMMFGAYGIYCDDKMFGIVGDGQLFVKMTKAGDDVWPGLPEVPPYEGAKPYYLVEDVDDGARLTAFVAATCEELPLPKSRKNERK